MRVPIFHILANTCYFLFFKNHNRPSACEVVSHCGFICISLMTNDVEHLYTCFLAISSLEKCLFKSLPIFKIELFIFYCCLIRVLYILWILDPYQIYDLLIFSLIL